MPNHFELQRRAWMFHETGEQAARRMRIKLLREDVMSWKRLFQRFFNRV